MLYTRTIDIEEWTGDNADALVAKWPDKVENHEGQLYMVAHEHYPPAGVKLYMNGTYLHIITEEELALWTSKV